MSSAYAVQTCLIPPPLPARANPAHMARAPLSGLADFTSPIVPIPGGADSLTHSAVLDLLNAVICQRQSQLHVVLAAHGVTFPGPAAPASRPARRAVP